MKITFCAILLATQCVWAASIGVNIIGSDDKTVTGVAGAPEYEQANWNNVRSPITSDQEPLIDNNGNTTTAVVEILRSAFVGTFNSLDTENKILMGGYVGTYLTNFEDNDGHQLVVEVRDIPYKRYSVVIYSDCGNDFDIVTRVKIGSREIFLRDPAGIQFDDGQHGFIEVPSTSNSDQGQDTPEGNYTVFKGLTDQNLKIQIVGTVQKDPEHPFGILSAMQIVEEPMEKNSPGDQK